MAGAIARNAPAALSTPALQVRPAMAGDIAQLINLQFEVYPPAQFPPINRWAATSLEAHQRVFPEGQLVATWDDRIVGAAVTLVGSAARFDAPHTFLGAIGTTHLRAHDPAGDALYGVDICVSPYFRGRGVARALYDARFALQDGLGLSWFYAGARIPGYGALSPRLDVATYIEDVQAGRRNDATLSAQLRIGFEVRGILPGYLEDPETADYAVLIRRARPLPEG